ncbi:phenylacetate--CoA ligase family protein [uncultured Prochlorococcus sp.]|uniref:phenylacetate--CoA ligase family protein n=1 Tax=uncultured Prochlorococcus sp. TaxID=159733 RepID=UPI002590361C|nr:hypothetical protein [uncultured Prochlorococcus sp.]
MSISNFEDSLLTLKGYFLAKRLMSKTQYFTRTEIEEYQIRAIYKLLNQVCTYIPYYKKLFWDYDFDVSKFDDLKKLRQLPILKKKDLLDAPQDFIFANEACRSLELSTSGTSGEPLKTFTSRNQWIIEQASIWRHWKWAGYKFRDKMAILRSYAPKNNEPIMKLNKLKNWLYVSPYHLDDKNGLEILKKLRKWQPKFLRGYPSSLYVLAVISRNYDIKIPSLKAALTASEVLTDEYRRVIEETFKIKVFDHYGQAEITTMIHECEKHECLHLLEDYAYTEFKNIEGTEEKSLIATNLFNYAMPLLRYDTGDKVILSKKVCSCGRSFKGIKKIIGRSDLLLFHKKGYYIPSINLYTYFSKLKEVSKFQVIQHNNNEIEVRIQLINANITSSKQIQYDIKNEFNDRFGTTIDLKITNEFITGSGGKCNPIIQKIKK